MNTITLNGVSSMTIKGLLISSLPPISKPLMRTQVEEIDGRDGDIVTPLGYAAYDKEVSIGLYGDFDINRVISFFASSGKVIFSNEPDKYYNYTITQQIDFERLLRFRTATVTFHVQPFKYSAIQESLIYNQLTNITEVTVVNTGNTTAKPTLTIYGSGDIGLYLDGVQIFDIALASEEYITINTAALEAFKGNTLKNRLVTGDYENFALKTGINVISWTGTITEIDISNYSRWI